MSEKVFCRQQPFWVITVMDLRAKTVVSTPEQKCIGWPEQKYINDVGKKAPELGLLRQPSGLDGMIRRRIQTRTA